MRARRILYFSAHQVTAFRYASGVLTAEGSFEADEAGRLEFAQYLAAHAKSIFSMLANVAEEGFHIETIPFLRGADRRAVIARKLAQLFFSATLCTSISLGYEKSRRKDERIMLAALTNQEAFAPWLAALARAQAPLAGLYSLPLLGPVLLKKLGISDPQCLLLTIQDQSIRQSYLEKGELHFSRLAPVPNSSSVGIAQTFASEAGKLQQYLVSQRLIGRQQPITAYLVAHASAKAAIEYSCLDSETLSFTVLDIDACARRCGLKTLPPDTHCEPLFLGLAATQPGRAQFASDSQRHDYHLWVLRAWLQGSGAIVLAACLLLSAKLLIDAHQLKRESELLTSETALARQRYQDIARTFPPIPMSNESLRGAIDRYAEIARGSASPEFLYREISRAIDAAAAVELEAIDWRAGSLQPQRLAAGNSPGAAPALEAETAVVRGTLRMGAESKPRQVLAALSRLIEALKRNPALEVEVLQQPFDVASGKSLKGGDADLEESQPRAFTLQIRKLGGR